jgi:hypothetical protein
MSDLPENLKYAMSHEWAQLEDDNVVRVGITDFAQEQLGDLVYIELPELKRKSSVLWLNRLKRHQIYSVRFLEKLLLSTWPWSMSPSKSMMNPMGHGFFVSKQMIYPIWIS